MDAEAFPQEVLTEDEPRYLRRQKPVEIRRRKFGKKAWKSYLRISVAVGATLAVAVSVYAVGAFLGWQAVAVIALAAIAMAQ